LRTDKVEDFVELDADDVDVLVLFVSDGAGDVDELLGVGADILFCLKFWVTKLT